MADEVDWREIFKKYVDVVGLNEGVDFLYEHNWSKDEWRAITEVLNELNEPFERTV